MARLLRSAAARFSRPAIAVGMRQQISGFFGIRERPRTPIASTSFAPPWQATHCFKARVEFADQDVIVSVGKMRAVTLDADDWS
jgi:hypothetical protein